MIGLGELGEEYLFLTLTGDSIMEDEQRDYRRFLEGDFPLIEKFRELAPGSYKHSQNVANICESIAVELKMDSDFMRVCGLYHDVGKMINPQFFTENQDEENPHDKLEPKISYQIISRHLSDTVAILLNYNFPIEVMKCVSQHHGNTVIKYFFDRSGSQNDTHYRYRCSLTPETDEAAILMIVDSVEATARSYSTNGKLETIEDRHQMIDDTINRLVDDGQLDSMKIGTLKVIRQILYKEIDSSYHKRVSYDDETVGEVRNGINGNHT
jgi:putative nucleotidyltransferase with HDIG domain